MSSTAIAFDVDVKSTFTCLYAKQCNATRVINTEMASARAGFWFVQEFDEWMNVQKPWITSVNSVASYITFALDSRGRLMNLLVNHSNICRDGLHLVSSGSYDQLEKKFFKIENPILGFLLGLDVWWAI